MKKDISFSYEKIRSSHDLKCPDNFNFGFDIISDKYGKSEKTALIAIQKSTKKVQKMICASLSLLLNFLILLFFLTVEKFRKISISTNTENPKIRKIQEIPIFHIFHIFPLKGCGCAVLWLWRGWFRCGFIPVSFWFHSGFHSGFHPHKSN